MRYDRLTHRVDYAAVVVSVRVPRKCVGNPARVRPNMASTLYTGGPGATFCRHYRVLRTSPTTVAAVAGAANSNTQSRVVSTAWHPPSGP